MKEIQNYKENIFESIKHIDENGNEYWYSRELQDILGYHQWRSMNELIERAKLSQYTCYLIAQNTDSRKK